jgi:hypothetical protein
MRLAAKWKGLVGLGVATAALSFAAPVMSADHRDAPAAAADAASDINDVYAFNDGGNVVLAMTVSPLAAAGAKFSDKTQYVFHTSSGAFGATTSNVDVICTFDTAQNVSCWVGTDDYVTGNASATAGISSTSGKTKVFTGMRADPFFFNLCGFRDAVALVDSVAGTLTFDAAGCPDVGAAATAVQAKLAEGGPTSDPGAAADPVTGYCKGRGAGVTDDFSGFNTLAIVVSVDKTLVTKGGAIMSVWGATYKAP